MLQSLSPYTLALAFLAGLATAAFGSGVVWLRWRLYPKILADRTVNLAMHAHQALAVLHALIMALVFAEAEIDYTRARESVWHEADLLESVFRDLRAIGTAASEETSLVVAKYTQAVVETEWDLLSENKLSPEASSLYETAFEQVLRLDTESSAELWLRDRILENLSALSSLRHTRFFEAHDQLPAVFWVVVVLGYLLLSLLFSVFGAKPLNLLIIATYSFFFGAVSYLIFAFQDPFDGHLKVTSQPIVLLYQEVMEPAIAAQAASEGG